jgi:outer membrane lipoprotein-sorting protein
MNRKRILWIFIGIVILAASLVSGFVLMQPSVEDILVQTIETAKTVENGHAVVAIDVDSIEKNVSSKIEVWARRGEEGPGAFRMEVLESDEAKAQDAVMVSDGETLWAYSPSENKVFVGTPEEAKTFMEEVEFMPGGLHSYEDGMPEDGEHQHPETPEEAVQKLLEYFNVSKAGSGTVADETAHELRMEPIPEQMPAEYTAVGGIVNLWIGQESSLPLAMEYTGGSMGEFSVTVIEFEVNAGVDENLFTFEIPADVEVVTFADLEPQSLTLAEASESAEFDFLTPAQIPAGATLVDILDVRGALVQRYTLPDGGSFTIAQGSSADGSVDTSTPSADSQSVDVRGTSGQLFESEDGTQVLLTWTDGDLYYVIAGDLTAEQALTVAESLQ